MKRMVTILVGIIIMCSVTACGSQAEPANYVETESSQSMVEAKTSETIREEVPAETPATTQWWMHVECLWQLVRHPWRSLQLLVRHAQ